MQVHEALRLLYHALAPHSETAVLDAQTALAALTQRSRAALLAHPEAQLTPAEAERVRQWAVRLARGEPLPYVLGEWPFYGRPFYVAPAVLIPRPETETLVETVLETLPPQQALRVVDVGTGSGCIALTLALERPAWFVVGADVSWPALQVARRNRERYRLEARVPLVQADLLGPLAGPWDAVVANLPYVPDWMLPFLPVSRWEPYQALAGGPDGLTFLRRLLEQAASRLRAGGHVFLELSPEQAPQVRAWLAGHPAWCRVHVREDLSHRPRVVWAVRCPHGHGRSAVRSPQSAVGR